MFVSSPAWTDSQGSGYHGFCRFAYVHGMTAKMRAIRTQVLGGNELIGYQFAATCAPGTNIADGTARKIQYNIQSP